MLASEAHITYILSTVFTLVGISDVAGDRDDGDRGDWITGPVTEA